MSASEEIRRLTGARSVELGERVQSLWSGYGEIVRARLDGEPVIVKHVRPPAGGDHPRGWNTDHSHQRKLRSYEVELVWYRSYAARCGGACRVPRTIAAEALEGGGWLFVLEDLDAAGFPERRGRLDADGVRLCLGWLAEFHATFLGVAPEGLWPTGTYWHLDTRPDELREMADGPLKEAAGGLDRRLAMARFQTFVHGDAKVANFCFAPDGGAVAAVDFQYVGGGCGMKDVAYFLGSCLDERECELGEKGHLAIYFEALREALGDRGVDTDALEGEWRDLYPVAWTDFYRFLAGWCPGHPKMNPYSERLAREVVRAL